MDTPTFPAASGSLMLDGPVGALELAVDLPEADVTAQPVVAVFCHPLSTEGGSMHNKVVTMAARALRELGITVVRFNFRSVGASAGDFDMGAGEQDDLAAVVDWVRASLPGHQLWLGGFSFGAYVSLRACDRISPAALISIAPPVGRREWNFDATQPPAQWLVVMGEADEIVNAQGVFDWVAAQPAPPQLVRMPDTTHFFHRKLIDLRGAIQHEVRRWLPD
jgi:uncharacterized protein